MPHHKSQVAAALFLAIYLSACAPVPPAGTAARPTVSQALCALGYSSIPLRTLLSGHHVVEGSLNGRPATFVVDSGAGRTVIHQPYVTNFGLEAGGGPTGTAIGAGGATAVSRVGINELTIASARTDLTGIFAMDLSHVVKALEPIVGGPVHGIIGQDVMQAQHAIIDVQQSRLYLNPLAGEERTGC
jgi:predicted aspartyl protease